MQHSFQRRSGFTLVELLAGILILSVLLTLAVPQYLSSLTAARTNQANTGAKIFATAIQSNYMRLGGTSYLNVITAAGLDNTANGTLTKDLGGFPPTNPCDNGNTFADYSIVSTAASLSVVPKDPFTRCSGLIRFTLNGP